MIKKIVLIDDEIAFCQLFTAMIKVEGDYAVQSYTCAQDALNNISKIQPQIVFVDMLMPDSDGGAIVKEIKEQLNPAPLIVMVTGMVAEDEIGNSAFPILAKPINKNSLKQILASID